MFEKCTMISTANMPREEWLELRRTGIGGSDATAIVGLSAWATPYTVYLDKLGLLPEKEDTEAMGTIWADSSDEAVDLFGMEHLFRQLKSLEESLSITTALKNQAINEIKARMQTAGSGSCGPYSCTWKTQQRRSLDLDALREDYPDICFDDYMKVTKSRPFRWKITE